jgi:UDP-N-acetylmuramoyl-tripeptide--D-alanyl-D-alanine ligase
MDPVPFKPQLTPDFLVRSLHLKIPILPRPHLPFTSIVTDSRKVQPGCLFVALKGDKFDGHEYIESALAQGARGILCRRGYPLPSTKDVCIFLVEDSLAAYRRLAGAWRREFSLPIVVVAGSVGKTTTKELLAAIFHGKWSKVLKTQGSQNGFVGIPMTLLDLRSEHEAAVIEVGIDEPGAMQQHMNLVGATAAVLTAIGPEHLEKLRDIPTVAREEGVALSTVAKSGGVVAINLDDPWIRPHLTTLREGRKIPYSLNGATTSIDMISGRLSENKKSLIYQGLGIKEDRVPLPLLGQHNASNLLAAISIAAGLGLTADEIKSGLTQFQGVEGRSEIREIPGKISVICDYYNAQPVSVTAGLELLSQIARRTEISKTKWACLGDMLELGPDEQLFHRELAHKILELEIENVLLFGPRMAALHEELQTRGFQGRLAHFASQGELAETLVQGVKSGDVILIKGSRGMRMEEVWKVLEPYAKAHWKRTAESQNPTPHT